MSAAMDSRRWMDRFLLKQLGAGVGAMVLGGLAWGLGDVEGAIAIPHTPPSPVTAERVTTENRDPLLARNDFVCPRDLESLIDSMLGDLPSYANRVSTRSRLGGSQLGGYVLIAGRPEFEPLTLGPGEWSAISGADPSALKQVFMTTLERQYTAGKLFSLQQYHWLFLTETTSGWRLTMMFTRTAIKSGKRPPTPPRDSSDGILAQAIRLWLNDCYAGSVRPILDK